MTYFSIFQFSVIFHFPAPKCILAPKNSYKKKIKTTSHMSIIHHTMTYFSIFQFSVIFHFPPQSDNILLPSGSLRMCSVSYYFKLTIDQAYLTIVARVNDHPTRTKQSRPPLRTVDDPNDVHPSGHQLVVSVHVLGVTST